MNQEDNFKEKFKQAIISTVKVISDDFQINSKNKNKISEDNLNIKNIENNFRMGIWCPNSFYRELDRNRFVRNRSRWK